MANAVLVLGYLLAVPFTLFVPGFLRLWRRRELWVFLTAQTGAVLIAVGWAVKDRWPSAAVNSAWVLGLTLAYVLAGRRRTASAGDHVA